MGIAMGISLKKVKNDMLAADKTKSSNENIPLFFRGGQKKRKWVYFKQALLQKPFVDVGAGLITYIFKLLVSMWTDRILKV